VGESPVSQPTVVLGRLAGAQERLTAFVSKRVDDPMTVREILSRVNERIVLRVREGESIDDVERFAFGVARNVLREHWREVKRQQAFEATLSETIENRPPSKTARTDTAAVDRAQMLDALHACIAQLSDTDRHIAEQCYGEGKSKENRAALAAELGINRNAVDIRISRIRAKLEACVRARLLGDAAP
jgi:RNA polymerase sigma factor (sigma-70 family)